MNHHPDRLVEQIERKMAGASYNKTEEEKAMELFDYQPKDAQDHTTTQQAPNVSFISKTLAQEALHKIFEFYATAYALLKINQRSTFEEAKDYSSIMNFQSFLLFCKQFKLVPAIFSLDSMAIQFKKHSNYGKSLTFDDFVNIVNSLSHQKEALAYFKAITPTIANREQAQEKDIQQLYSYLGLNNKSVYTSKFRSVVEAFGSSAKVQGSKIPYKYRKMPQEQLMVKVLHKSTKNISKSPMKVAKNESSSSKFIRQSNPQIIVSWQSLQKGRTPSMGKLNRISTLFPEEDDDKIYLKEYNSNKAKAQNLRKQIQKRITDLNKQDNEKQKQLLGRVGKQKASYLH